MRQAPTITFNYAAPARLMSHDDDPEQLMRKGWKRVMPLGFGQFARAADALRFAIEELAPELRGGAYLEVGDTTFDSVAMKRLYDDSLYPWPRMIRPAAPQGPPPREQ